MKVNVTKISESEVPNFKSAEWVDFIVGKDNGDVSLPIDYEIEGNLMADIVVGEGIKVLRNKRNGVESYGTFITSPVVEISEDRDVLIVETNNSIYLVSKL